MTNAEYRKILEDNGIAAADIKKIQYKFDAEKITETVENATSPDEAFKALHDLYPELKVEELKKQSNFMMNQLAQAVEEVKKKGSVELTAEELDCIAGGGIFSDIGNWFSNNWKKILVGAAIFLVSVAAFTVGGAALGLAGGAILGAISGQGALGGAIMGGLLCGASGLFMGSVGTIYMMKTNNRDDSIKLWDVNWWLNK